MSWSGRRAKLPFAPQSLRTGSSVPVQGSKVAPPERFHTGCPVCPLPSPAESVETVEPRKIMNAQVSSRNGESSKAQSDAARTGRHARPVTSSAAVTPDIYRNRSQDRIRVAERTLRDAHARVRAAGADSDVVSTAFGIARDALTQAHQIVHEARKELIVVHHEYDELNRRLENLSRSRYYPVAAAPIVPDAPCLS